MNRTIAELCAAVLVLSAPFGAVAAQTTYPDSAALGSVRRAIDDGNAQWAHGWATRDAAMVARLFAVDGIQLANSGAVTRGRRAIEVRQRTAMGGVDSGVKVTILTTRVWLDGSAAYETGTYRYDYTENGKPGALLGKYVTIWRRGKDGVWRLAMDMGLPET